ncbi:hypothetical protein ACFQ4C_07760, partial [Larkinella insperata]
MIDDQYIVSHGGAPGSQQSQEASWIKSLTRTRNSQLAFWPGQLEARARVGQRVRLQPLVGTYSDATPYTIDPAGLPGWLRVETLAGGTDEAGTPVALTLDASGLVAGEYRHTVVARAAGYRPASVTVHLRVEGSDAGGVGPVVARINAGGPAVVSNGVSWSGSQYFTGGKSYTNTKVTSIAD